VLSSGCEQQNRTMTRLGLGPFWRRLTGGCQALNDFRHGTRLRINGDLGSLH